MLSAGNALPLHPTRMLSAEIHAVRLRCQARLGRLSLNASYVATSQSVVGKRDAIHFHLFSQPDATLRELRVHVELQPGNRMLGETIVPLVASDLKIQLTSADGIRALECILRIWTGAG